MKRHVFAALAAAALCLPAAPANAQTDTHSLPDSASVVPAVPTSGSSVLYVDSATLAGVRTLPELLRAHFPGVLVQSSSGTLGAAPRIHIRGARTTLEPNPPLLVIDGIRANAEPADFSIDIGGQQISRLDDIQVEDIQQVEVLAGVAAVAEYGAEGADGVIRVTTRRGLQGGTRWRAYAEGEVSQEVTSYPANYDAVSGSLPLGESCTLFQQAKGECAPEKIISLNPLEEVSPFRNGLSLRSGLSAMGGGDLGSFYAAAHVERADGVVEPNERDRTYLRANGATRAGPLDVGVSAGYLDGRISIPSDAYLRAGLFASALHDRASGGYLQGQTPEALFRMNQSQQDVQRVTSGVTAQWEATFRLVDVRVIGRVGTDRTDNQDHSVRLAETTRGSPVGSTQEVDAFTDLQTLGGEVRASWRPTLKLFSETTIGIDRIRREHEWKQVARRLYIPSLVATEELSTKVRVSGASLGQRLDLGEHVSMVGTVRGDWYDIHRSEVDPLLSATLSAEWQIFSAPSAPDSTADGVTIRVALGRTERPLPLFTNVVFTPPATVPSEPDFLTPERVRDTELGFSATVLRGRISTDLLVFERRTDDLLAQVLLSPSRSVFNYQNVGTATERGIQGVLDAALLNSARWRVNIRLTGSVRRDRSERIDDKIGGASALRRAEGYPLGAYFGRRLLDWTDRNGDGIISPRPCFEILDGDCEVLLSEQPEYLGTSFPTRTLSVTPTVAFGSRVHLSAQLDYRGGHKLWNRTEENRCSVAFVCRENVDPTTPLAEQAKIIAAVFNNRGNYIEDADFVKLREVALRVRLPDRWIRPLPVRSANVTVAGYNLATWTGYSGFDPEVNDAGPDPFRSMDYFTQPPVRRWVTRVDLAL